MCPRDASTHYRSQRNGRKARPLMRYMKYRNNIDMRKKKRVHGSGGVCDRVHSRVRRWIGLDGWFNSSQWLGKGKFNSFYLTYSLKPQQVGSQVPIEDSGLEDEEWPGMKMVSLFVGQTVRSIRIQTPPCSITSCSVWRKGILASKLENIRW